MSDVPTTYSNKKHTLDPALIRPGRADVIVEFKNASRFVCEGLFKVFYPLSGAFPVRYPRRMDAKSNELDVEKGFKSELTITDIEEMARNFAALIPEGDFSPAQIQGGCRPLSGTFSADVHG
jgi:chaperone BCS1